MGLFDIFGKKKQEIRPTQPCGVVNDNLNDNVKNAPQTSMKNG